MELVEKKKPYCCASAHVLFDDWLFYTWIIISWMSSKIYLFCNLIFVSFNFALLACPSMKVIIYNLHNVRDALHLLENVDAIATNVGQVLAYI